MTAAEWRQPSTTVLCRFDSAGAFSLLRSSSTVRGPLSMRVGRIGKEACLKIAYQAVPADPADAVFVLALPVCTIRAAEGAWQLDLVGDGSECQVWLEAADALGTGMVYCLGALEPAGRQVLTKRIDSPDEAWADDRSGGSRELIAPVQVQRIGFALGGLSKPVDVRLISLGVTGPVIRSPGGIA